METTIQATIPVYEKHASVQIVQHELPPKTAMNLVNNAANFVNTPAGTPTLNSGDVRVVRPDEYKQAARSLAEAFAEDEVARYFTHTPDRAHWTEQKRWDLHVSILEYIVYAHILNGLVLTAGPDFGCVALWMPPGKNMDDWLTILRSGQWRLNFSLSTEGKARYFEEFLPLLHQTKMNVLKERDDDSWYLVYIGTRPAAQRMGLAKKLIQHVTAIADKEGRAAYLESSHSTNLPFYRRMGFEPCRRIYLQRQHEQIELDVMVREPVVNGA